MVEGDAVDAFFTPLISLRKSLKIGVCLYCVVNVGIWCCVAFPDNQNSDRQKLMRILEDPLIPRLDFGKGITMVSENAESTEFSLPPEVLVTKDVICQNYHGSARVNRRFGYVSEFVVVNSVAFFPERTVSRGTAEATASKFMRKHYTFMEDGIGRLDFRPRPGIGSDGNYLFEWRKVMGDVFTDTHVAIAVRAYDGLVVSCVAGYTDYLVKSKTTVSAETALQIARDFCRKEWPKSLNQIELLQQRKEVRLVTGDDHRLVYVNRFRLVPEVDGEGGGYVVICVDCDSGRPTMDSIVPLPSNENIREQPEITIDDSWPFCAGDWIAFLTNRKLQGFPAWLPPKPHLFLFDTTTHQLSYLLLERDMPVLAACLVAEANLCALQTHQRVYTCRLNDGNVLIHTTDERPGMSPSLSPDGKYVAMSAKRSSGDVDVFVADVENSLKSSKGQWRVALLPGEDILPVFAPDGNSVAFGHREPSAPMENYHEGWSVCRVKPHRAYWENDRPEKIVGVSGYVQRLTWFPDAKRLLVWHSRGLEIADVEGRSVAPVNLPVLHDPDLPWGKPLQMKDVSLDAKGEHLVFSGLRWSGDMKDTAGRYIYVCRLDGSEVRRLSPLEDTPIPPYIFPTTGQSALELAKERVRKELDTKVK